MLSYNKSITLRFVTAVKDAYPSCMGKAKIHLILHFPEIMIKFELTIQEGTAITNICSHNFHYRCESFNYIVRSGNVFSNRRAPSCDIAIHFSVSESLIKCLFLVR